MQIMEVHFMKSKVSKFGISLVVIFNLLIALLVSILFIILINDYFPKTIKANDFTNYIENRGCSLKKLQDNYKGVDTFLTTNKTCPYLVGYITFNDKDVRNNSFKNFQSDVFNNKNIRITKSFKLDLFKQYYEYSTSGDYYKAVTLNDNTLLYAAAPKKYKTEIINIFKHFKYTQDFDLTVTLLITSLSFIITIFYVICLWGTLKKTRNNPVCSLIPIYNIGCLTKDVFGSTWYVIFAFIVPYVNILFTLILMYNLGRRFNKTKIYSVLLAIIPSIFWPLLAYGDSVYHKPIKNKESKERKENKESFKLESIKETNPIKIKKEKKLITIIKWILTIILLLLSAILLLTYFDEQKILYLLNTIMFLIYGMLSCPEITKYTRKNEKYTHLKPWIITTLIIAHFIIFCIFPA